MKATKFYDSRGIPFCTILDNSTILLRNEVVPECEEYDRKAVLTLDYERLVFDLCGLRGCATPKDEKTRESLKKLLASKLIS